MTYTLTIPIEAPSMAGAERAAWNVLRLLPTGTPYAIKATPEPKQDIPTHPKGRTWTPEEIRDIEDGIVPASRRYDAEFVAAVEKKAGGL